MKLTKLCQVIAVAQGVKSRHQAKISEIHHKLQKTSLCTGVEKTYVPDEEGGEQLPPESARVQLRVEDALCEIAESTAELFDVVLTQDRGNCEAKADVEVDGKVILTQVPVTYLLFVEKQLEDQVTLLRKLPALDPAEQWHQDANDGLFKTNTLKKHRTKKVQKPLVLYPATVEHPAQTQIITEDIKVGEWHETKLSGALPQVRITTLLRRAEKLLQAVKAAREAANGATVEPAKVGEQFFAYLYG